MTGNLIWLASYPKSGNTWFRAVFSSWQTGRPVDLNALGSDSTGSIASSVERFETTLGLTASLLHPDEVHRLRPRADEVTSDRLDSPSVCKIHDALTPGPGGGRVVSAAATRCAVYMVRDPRDVAVSYAHHRRSDLVSTVAAMADADHKMAVRQGRPGRQLVQQLGTWSAHVDSWTVDPPFPVHVLHYEDCVADPVTSFGAAIRSMGFDADDRDVADAVDRTSFDVLSAQEAATGFAERPAGVERFFRQGRAGSWVDELDPELARRLTADHHGTMERLGYLVADDERLPSR